jgi:hypothetical protein
MKDEFSSWVSIGLCGFILFAFLLYGCSSVPPSLNITEKQVDAKIQELLDRPVTSNGVQYDAVNDKYVVDPSTARVLVNDEVRLQILEGEVIPAMNTYLAENPPATFKDKAKWFSWGALVGAILTIVGAGFASGSF